MEFGISLPLRLSTQEKISYIHHVESLNFSHIWVGDAGLKTDVFTNVKLVLMNSTHLQGWTGVTSPFYYDLQTLIEVINSFVTKFKQRFGLGLGIGNIKILPPNIKKKPFHYFKLAVTKILENLKSNYDNLQGNIRAPPIAIGALGNKMCQFAFQVADILLVNSASPADLIHISSSRPVVSSTKILAYGMLDILKDEKDTISPFVWNIVKNIAMSLPIRVLKDHGYSNAFINKIKSLGKGTEHCVPKGEFLELARDFAFVGTLDQILEKVETIKELSKRLQIEGIVFGWHYKDKHWDKIEEIVNELKK